MLNENNSDEPAHPFPYIGGKGFSMESLNNDSLKFHKSKIITTHSDNILYEYDPAPEFFKNHLIKDYDLGLKEISR